MTDTLWDDDQLQAFLMVKSKRHFLRVKKKFPSIQIATGKGTLTRYDPDDIKAVLEGMKTARPRAQHEPRTARRTG
jgi:hypothetical protein